MPLASGKTAPSQRIVRPSCGNSKSIEQSINRSGGAVATTSGRLDPQAVTSCELTRSLARQLFRACAAPPEEIAAPSARLAAGETGRRVATSFCEERVLHVCERLRFANQSVAAVEPARPAGSPAKRVFAHPERELDLERLDRRVERVAHRDVDSRWPRSVRAGALPTTDRLVVGERVVS